MESKTPFDLNRAIQQWRENLAQSPAVCREDMHELETHLRDSIADLHARNLSVEEAFWVASKRFGSDTSVEGEFEKVNAKNIWLDRVFWMLGGYLVFGLVGGLLHTLGASALSFGFSWLQSAHLFSPDNPTQINPTIVAIFTVVYFLMFVLTLISCWHLFTRSGRRYANLMTNNMRRPGRIALMGIVVAIVAFVMRIVQYIGPALTARYLPYDHYQGIIMGQAYGNMFSSIIELLTFVVIALWLARRRWLVNMDKCQSS